MLHEYKTNGFYTERGFFSESYMDTLRNEIDSIGLDFKDEMHPHKKSPIIKEIIFDGVLRGMVHKFIGNNIPIQSQLRFKPPSTTGFPYHQDDYWTQAGFGNTINVLVHIDEATIDNGCIYVLPKSHKPPFHEDRSRGHAPADNPRGRARARRPPRRRAGDAPRHEPHVHGAGEPRRRV